MKDLLLAKGRVGRLNYFLTGLLAGFPFFIVVLWVVSQGGDPLISATQNAEQIGQSLSYMQILSFIPAHALAVLAMAYLMFGYVNVCISIRRLHDLDKSGWLSILVFVPYINTAMSIYLLFFPGTPGENKYGVR